MTNHHVLEGIQRMFGSKFKVCVFFLRRGSVPTNNRLRHFSTMNPVLHRFCSKTGACMRRSQLHRIKLRTLGCFVFFPAFLVKNLPKSQLVCAPVRPSAIRLCTRSAPTSITLE